MNRIYFNTRSKINNRQIDKIILSNTRGLHQKNIFKATPRPNIIIRPITIKDVKKLASWFNQLVDENPGIVEDYHVTQAKELYYLNSLLKEIERREVISFVIEKDSKILGKVDLRKLKRKIDRHVGEVSFGILKGYPKYGIELLRELSRYTYQFDCHVLTYYILNSNKYFINIFKKAGYKVSGRIKNYYNKNGLYFDRIILVHNSKSQTR